MTGVAKIAAGIGILLALVLGVGFCAAMYAHRVFCADEERCRLDSDTGRRAASNNQAHPVRKNQKTGQKEPVKSR